MAAPSQSYRTEDARASTPSAAVVVKAHGATRAIDSTPETGATVQRSAMLDRKRANSTQDRVTQYMITPEQMLDAVADPQVRSLKTGAFLPADVVNLILQRSEIICDQPRPGRVIKAWTEGDASPALALVDRMGDELIKRAAAISLLDYRELFDTIRAMTPRRVADIGCGYAIFDLVSLAGVSPGYPSH